MKVFIVTHHNGRIWSVHSTRDAAETERGRAIRADLTYGSGVEEVEVDGPLPRSEDEAVTA